MILVTGAGGTLGREVVAQLELAGIPFRAAYRTKAKAEAAQARGVDAVVLDYNRLDTLRAAFRGTDRLFLLAPSSPNQEQLELNVLAAAKVTGVQRLVKQSVWKANEEGFGFAKVHRSVEKAIEGSGLLWTFLRSNSFMQNLVTYEGDSIRREGVFYSASAAGRISHVDVRDLARVAVRALTEPGHERKAYAISGPEPLTYDEIAAELTQALGRPISHASLAPSDLKAGMISMGLDEGYVDLLIDLERYFREGAAAEVTNDVKRVTGRDPIRFPQFARDYASLLQPSMPMPVRGAPPDLRAPSR